MTPRAHFSPALFKFLRDLRANNDRDWFQANKERYEDKLRHPAQQFISDFGPRLAKISPHFNADPRPVGGSLFRIYRDVRFSKDKSPTKPTPASSSATRRARTPTRRASISIWSRDRSSWGPASGTRTGRA